MKKVQETIAKKQTLGTLSVVFACLSLFILPPLFGLAGFVIGLVGVCKREGANSIVGLVLSIVFPPIGMLLGLLFFAAALS